jgi:transcriptional regulator with XRE-family HTH domain
MKYYVYTLARPDGTVFYVGKGCGSRIKHHEQEALRGHNCPKCELIRSIWHSGGTVHRAIMFETDDEQAALAHEMALIDSYGPDQLANQSGGWLFRSTRLPAIRSRPPTDDVFTGLLKRLFATHRWPNGKEYSVHEVAAHLNEQLSPGYLAKLRHGTSSNPSRTTLLLLCQFFQVPSAYFFPELDEVTAEARSAEEQLVIAVRSSSLSDEAQYHVLGLIRIMFKAHTSQ